MEKTKYYTSQRESEDRLKSMRRDYIYDFGLEGSDFTEFFYGSDCLLTEKLTTPLTPSQWRDTSKFNYEYNSNNKLSLETYSQTGVAMIYNSIGQLIESLDFQVGERCRSINLTSYAEGKHFLQITIGDIQETQAFMIVH